MKLQTKNRKDKLTLKEFKENWQSLDSIIKKKKSLASQSNMSLFTRDLVT